MRASGQMSRTANAVLTPFMFGVSTSQSSTSAGVGRGFPILLLVVVSCGRLLLHLHRFLLISFVEFGFLGVEPETSGNLGCIAEQIIAQPY